MINFSIPERLSENLIAFMTTCFQKEMASVRFFCFLAWAEKNKPTAEQLSYKMELFAAHEKNDAEFKVGMYHLKIPELEKMLSECKRIGFVHCTDDLNDHLRSMRRSSMYST
jgi:hypothetical protein